MRYMTFSLIPVRPLASAATPYLSDLSGCGGGGGTVTGFWESRKQKAESRKGVGGMVVGVLIVLLAGAAVWQGETGHLFQYRGLARWSGPWDNPNTFGVLMGVGAALAVGLLVQSPKSKAQ
jgi:hypothetical protein